MVRQMQQDLTDETAIALGLSSKGVARKLLAPLVRRPTQRVAEWLIELDRLVLDRSTREAARTVVSHLVSGVHAHGVERVPSEGPLVFACNHPGAVDGLIALSEMHRGDIKVFATSQPIFHRLRCAEQLVIFVPRPGGDRMRPVREAIRHLRAGGSVLIMPGGHVEPDPAILPGAREDMNNWSPSLEMLLRSAPEAQLQVTIVSGVLEPRWMRHPLVRLRKGGREKQLLAEFLMVIWQAVLGRREALVSEVTFGQPVTAAQLRGGGESGMLMPAIIQYAQSVLDEHMARMGSGPNRGLAGGTVGGAGL